MVSGSRGANFKEVPARGEHSEGRGGEWRDPAHGGMLERSSQPRAGRGSCFRENFSLGVREASLWKVGDSLEAGPSFRKEQWEGLSSEGANLKGTQGTWVSASEAHWGLAPAREAWKIVCSGFRAWKGSGPRWGSRAAQYRIPRLGCRKCAGGGRCQSLAVCVLQVLEGMKEDQVWKGTQLQEVVCWETGSPTLVEVRGDLRESPSPGSQHWTAGASLQEGPSSKETTPGVPAWWKHSGGSQCPGRSAEGGGGDT